MLHETTKRDPERIYLEPWPYSPEGRLWSEEDVWPLYTWPPEPEGESERATGIEYIRADLHDAEIARLTRELEEARSHARRVVVALRAICDVVPICGPPLERRREDWEAALIEADEVLGELEVLYGARQHTES